MNRIGMAIAMVCFISLATPTLVGGRSGGHRGGSRGHHGFRGHGHGHSHGHHGHWRHHFRGPRVFFGGAFGWPYYDPWYYGPYVYAPPVYAYPYSYPYYPYSYSYPYPYAYPSTDPDDHTAASRVPQVDEERGRVKGNKPTSEEAMQVTYGLVQLRGVPEGASIDLDGRFWMHASRLDQRWLALPRGRHTITVRASDRDPVERTVDVTPGKNIVVRI